MKITFLGGVNTVTGSKFLIEHSDNKVLIDCGLFQGLKQLRLKNWERLPVQPKNLSAVLLTHAHIDHSGYIPLLVKEGFKGKIYCSNGTFQLCKILLSDSGHLQEEDAKRANDMGFSKHDKALPLYTQKDAVTALKSFHPVDYGKTVELNSDIAFDFIPGGHIIGASMINFHIKNKKILFSGDLGRLNDSVMRAPSKVEQADYLVVESTYGNRLHDTRNPEEELKKIIDDIVVKKGVLLIPSFAVGRAQTLIFLFNELKRKKMIPDIPVYLDSPMSINATEIFLKNSRDHKLSEQQLRQFNRVNYVSSAVASEQLATKNKPFVLISSSGMMTGGRVLNHVVHFGQSKNNTILFCGYQAMGTRGYDLLHGEKNIKIYGEYITVEAQVKSIDSLSSHVDYGELLSWLETFKSPPKKTFIVHGEQDSADALRKKIKEKFQWECIVPDYKDVYKL